MGALPLLCGNEEQLIPIYAFWEFYLAEECAWQTAVLILKVCGKFHGIGHIKVLWKTVMEVVNHRITLSIDLHDTIHGFCSGRRTDTDPLEANLIQQLTEMR